MILRKKDSYNIAQFTLLKTMPIICCDKDNNNTLHLLAKNTDLNKETTEALIKYYLNIQNQNNQTEVIESNLKEFFFKGNNQQETFFYIAIHQNNKNFLSFFVNHYPDLIDDNSIVYSLLKVLIDPKSQDIEILKLIAENKKLSERIRKFKEYQINKEKIDQLLGWNGVEIAPNKIKYYLRIYLKSKHF